MSTSNKSVPVIVIGIAALAAVAYFGMNYPTDSDDAAGTVAPAERYRADQAGADEIQLGDQDIQEVLQSDVFARLIADDAFRGAMRDEEFKAAFNGEKFRGAMAASSEALRGSSEALRGRNSEALKATFDSEAFRGVAGMEKLRGAIGNSEELRTAFSSPEFLRSISSPELLRAMSSDELRGAMQIEELRNFMSRDEFRSGMSAAAEELRGGNAEALKVAFNSEAFRGIAGMDKLRTTFGNSEALSAAFMNEKFRGAFTANADQLRGAVEAEALRATRGSSNAE